ALAAILGLVEVSGRQRLHIGVAGLLVFFAVWSMTSTRELPSGMLHFEVSPYQTLRVSESSGHRFLYGDRTLYSSMRLEDQMPALAYQRYAAGSLLLNPEIKSLLSIGMGSGGVGSYLRTALPDLDIDFVEIDPAVVRVARQFFFFQDDPQTRAHVDDARQFLRRSEKRWDYIHTDAYIGLSIPFHLTTVEFFDEVKRHLTPDGIVGINVATTLDAPFPQAILHTLANRFSTVFAFAVRSSSNVYIMATDSSVTMPKEEMIRVGGELDQRFDLEPSLALIAASRLDIAFDPTQAVILSDRFAPANHLVAIGSKTLDLQ
ncbi:MAG: fused MFS/spermidine synthase, partial [Thermoanaerobaculia bacterium]